MESKRSLNVEDSSGREPGANAKPQKVRGTHARLSPVLTDPGGGGGATSQPEKAMKCILS